MSYQAHETAVIDAGCEIGEGTHIDRKSVV